MSYYKTGFDNYDDELVKQDQDRGGKIYDFRLRVNETKEIILLDDTGFRYNEHSLYDKLTNKYLSVTCKHEMGGEECLLCKAQIKSTPIIICTVKDMSGWVDNSGNRKGVGDLKLFKIKKTAAKRIHNIRLSRVDQLSRDMWERQNDVCLSRGYKSQEDVKKAIMLKGNVLKNAKLRASRYGDKAENCGDEFNLVEFVKPEIFRKEDVPFDYNKEFAPKENSVLIYELKQFYGNNAPPALAALLGVGTNAAAASPQGQSSQAPAFSESDIPF